MDAEPGKRRQEQQEGSGDTGKGRSAAKRVLLPVGHVPQRVEVVAHVEGSGVAEPRDAQVEVEQVPPVALRLRGHADGRALPLLHQRQVSQQRRRFLLAGAEEEPHPGLHQGAQRPVVVLRPLERARQLSCAVQTQTSGRFKH